MFTVSVKNSEGKEIETIKLDESVFSDKILSSSVHTVINSYRYKQRKGLAATKTRGEVSGGGKKPWKQKGTGRARVGSTRSPLWRHGGVTFGPHPRDFSFEVPKKMKTNALKFVLTEKVKSNDLIVVDTLAFKAPKTKEGVSFMTTLELGSSPRVLILVGKMDESIKRAMGNIGNVTVEPATNVTTYEILAATKVVITKDGLKQLTDRIKAA